MKQYELTEVLDGNYSNWSLCFEMWPCIQALNIKPYKDGNQWCFLYGENIQDGICGFGKTIRDAALDFYCNICNEEIVANKLKSLRPQPKSEWSEEDENCIRNLESVIYYDKNLPTDTRIKLGDFLKSLRSQSHWKPSEHQMTILKNVKDYVGKGSGYWGEGLGSLIDDLEKLM